MNLYLSSFADFYAALLLVIVTSIILRKKDYYTLRERVLFGVVFVTTTLLIIEGLSFIVDGEPLLRCRILNYATNYYLYLITPFSATLWALYIDLTMTTTEKHVKKVKYYSVFIVLSLIPVLLNPFTSVIFSIDSSNYFVRGDYFWFIAAVFYGLFVYMLVLTIKHRHNVEPYVFWSVLTMVILPPVGGLLQVFFLGVASIHTTLALGLAMVYMSLETVSASRDSLTKSFTRQKVLDFMESSLRTKTPFTVIMVDMDNLKEINDTHGHHEGDRALIDLATSMRKVCDRHYIVSRIGGDEFLIVTPVMQMDDLEERLEELRDSLNEDRVIKIHFSWGYYMMRHETEMSVDDILVTVDERMYQQKARNKNYRRRRSDRVMRHDS